MKQILLTAICLTSTLFSISVNAATESAVLNPQKPIILPGEAGRFDFMEIDESMQRLLAAHKGTGTLTVLNLKTGTPLTEVRVGKAQGVAVDTVKHQYFVGNDDEHTVAVVDSDSLKKVAEINVAGPVDAIAFDSTNRMLYADEDNGTRIWVIDITSKKVVTTIPIPGEPEVIEYDAVTDRIYQNIKTKNSVVRIDPTTNQIDGTWSTLPATSPHGMEIDAKRELLFSAGGNGKMVALDLKSGKVVSSVEIAPKTDQIAYDAVNQTIYCAGKGFISVVKVNGNSLKSLGDVPSPNGAHTLAVDPSTHDIWISFSDTQHSYFQRFKASPRAR